jgi:hypothetical protein
MRIRQGTQLRLRRPTTTFPGRCAALLLSIDVTRSPYDASCAARSREHLRRVKVAARRCLPRPPAGTCRGAGGRGDRPSAVAQSSHFTARSGPRPVRATPAPGTHRRRRRQAAPACQRYRILRLNSDKDPVPNRPMSGPCNPRHNLRSGFSDPVADKQHPTRRRQIPSSDCRNLEPFHSCMSHIIRYTYDWTAYLTGTLRQLTCR